jgi:PAS domain S-box-containing protein
LGQLARALLGGPGMIDELASGPASRRERTLELGLQRAHAFVDAIVENIPDMIFVKRASDLMFERFNRAGEELLGIPRLELIGKTDHDFYPKEQADFFHEKDRETLRNKKLVDIPEEPIQTRLGPRWLHTKKVPVLDESGEPIYLLGISEDITARKLVEERVRSLERELASVVHEAAEAIVTWRLDGEIASWNPAAEILYGIPAEGAIGTRIEELVPEPLRDAFSSDLAKIVAGEILPMIETYRLRGSHEIEIEERLFALHDAAGVVVRIASIAHDVSEVARLLRVTELLERNRGPKAAKQPRSEPMRQALAHAEVVAHDPSATVLLTGETGVGKSWLARIIHTKSPRAGKPFFEVNCASLARELVESELFGHERGAFTGALSQKRGIVEVADGGTIFLDEVGELPTGAQAQLLTFLDKKTFRRVGGTRPMQANVRLIAATNIDLKQAADKGNFRRDLFYRLSVVPIEVPPLRERREEIPELAREIVDELAARAARRRSRLDRTVLEALRRHDWPGNVRELRNALERALILSRGEPITLDHLPAEIRGRGRSGGAASDRLEDVERTHIIQVLGREKGNRTRAAEALGISRSTLLRKLAELKLEV